MRYHATVGATNIGAIRARASDRFACNRCGRVAKVNKSRGIARGDYFCSGCISVMRDLGDLPSEREEDQDGQHDQDQCA